MRTDAGGRQIDAGGLCAHLRPYLDALLRSGAKVQEVNVDAWTKCKLQVMCDKGPSLAEAERQLRLPDGIELWQNKDPHYSLSTGLFCRACAHSLEWPSEGGLPGFEEP